MWKRLSTWLQRPPIADDVDRRNAPVMQLLMLCYGVLLPATWAWRIAGRGGIADGWGIVLVVDMAVALLSLSGVVLIRRGRFRPAVMLFLVALLGALQLTFLTLGAEEQLIDHTPVILSLVIAGLVLGRRALWVVYGVLMLIFASGFMIDLLARDPDVPVRMTLRNVPSTIIAYLLITTVLDRSIQALRESLAESNAQRRALQREMAERERTQSQLVHAQKMEASGRLAGGIAHDFNHILGVILGFAGQRHRLPEDVSTATQNAMLADSLEGVEIAAHRGTAITQKLLTFGRRDASRPVVFDAAQALGELRPMLRQLLPPAIRLTLATGDDAAAVRMDRSAFDLMVLNLAANARDAMQEDGHFTATLGLDADRVTLSLTDDGQGIHPALLDRIFEPFFSTKAAADGTGLGLAVIRDLLTAAAGTIAVESRPGHGSTFIVSLPRVVDAATSLPR